MYLLIFAIFIVKLISIKGSFIKKLLNCYVLKVNSTKPLKKFPKNVLFDSNKKSTNFNLGQDCSKDLQILQSDQFEKSVFIGCQVSNELYNNNTVNQIFDSFYCGTIDNLNNLTAVTVIFKISLGRRFVGKRMKFIKIFIFL